MTRATIAAVVTVALLAAAARSTPRSDSGLVFYLRGVHAGEERWSRSGDTLRLRVTIDRGPGVELQGTIVRHREGPPEVSVSGRQFPWTVRAGVESTPAATLPVAALAELATRLEEGPAGRAATSPAVSPCGTHRLAGAELRCRAILGLGWGATLLWLDSTGAPAAAFIPTPLGPLVGVRPSESAAAAGDSVLSIAAPVTLQMAGGRLPRNPADDFAIVGARILTMAESSGSTSPIAAGTILVRDGRIAAVGAAREVEVPAGVRRLRGRGMTVLPGLWDSHAHLKQAEWLPAYLAAGITTVRDLGGDDAFLQALRRAAETSAVSVWPRIVAAGFINAKPAVGKPYTSAAAGTPEEARALVRRYRNAGYELIKLWNALDDEVAAAAIAEAHSAGMRVTWHVPDGVDADAALAAGVDEINHAWSVLSFGDAAFRRSSSGRSTLRRLADRGIVVDPTLVVAAYQARPRTETLARFEPCAAWMPAELVRAWAGFGATPDALPAAREQLRRAMRAVKALQEAGVPIVAGSDQGIPGCTLVRELELYVDAGLTPFEALRTATVTPARVAGLLDRAGTIEPGKSADLTVVAGDPLADISALRRVHLVVRAGRVLRPEDLRKAAQLSR